MQEYSFDSNVFVRDSLPDLSLTDEEINRIKKCPASMYMLSLRTHSKLPDELHEAMLLFSFDPEHSECVRGYMSWVVACQDRLEMLERIRRSEKINERIIAAIFFATFAFMVFMFFFF
jgi:hypothetical protein